MKNAHRFHFSANDAHVSSLLKGLLVASWTVTDLYFIEVYIKLYVLAVMKEIDLKT
jgi:hypothetical protein